MLGMKATHAFLRPSRSLQSWLVGRQVKSHPAAASHAVEGEVRGSWHTCPIYHDVPARQTWAPCSGTASYLQNVIVVDGTQLA